MSIDNQIWELAEAHVQGRLSATEQTVLQERLQSDTYFAAEFQECLHLIQSMAAAGRQQRMRHMLQDIHNNTTKPRTIPLRAHYWRTAAVAASIALLTSFGTYWGFNHTYRKATSQYSVLRRELDNIKNSQNQLIRNINASNRKPLEPARYTGSGFALSNDGYFVTNYHVTDGADSIYIQCNDGNYYKSYIVASDQQNDLAILKVEDKGFRFGKGEVPYTFAKGKSGMVGERVFSLGFPGNDIVYSEGYISSPNGYRNDSMQYRMVLPSDFGQSGAPVLDNKGNVLAILSGKLSESESNTYAVSTKALHSLLHALPKDINIHMPKASRLAGMSREEQVAKLQNYTCSVKVFKR